MTDCCKQMAKDLSAIKAELAGLKSAIAQKPNKGEIPNLVKAAMAGALPLLLPQALNNLSPGSIPNLVSKIQAPPLQLNPRMPLPTDVVLSPNNAKNLQQAQQALAQQNRALQNTVNQLQQKLRPLQTQLDKLNQLGQKLQPLAAKVAPILNAASLASSLAAAGISIGNLIVMVKRFNQIDKNEAVTINALSDLLTKIGVLNSRTKNLQDADVRLNTKIERAIDLSESNKIAISNVAQSLDRTNGTANTAIIQARRAESNIQTLNSTIASNRAINQQMQGQITALAQQTVSASILAGSAVTASRLAQNTANSAQVTANSAQVTANSAQVTANSAQNTANSALSNSRSALNTSSQALNQQPITVQNNTIIQPIRERVIQKTETLRTQVVQTREIHTRELQTREIQTLREVQTLKEIEVIDPQTKAAISRIEGITTQNQTTLNNHTAQLNNIGNQTNNIQNGVNQQTTRLSNIANQTNNIQNGVNETNGRLQNLNNKVQENFTKTQERFDKLSRWLRLPQIINILTLIVTLHNAAMLSRSLIETLGEIIDTGLLIVGLRDEEGKAFDISEILGKSASNLMKSILGEKVWTNAVSNWQKANRVHQSASNILTNVRSMFASTREIAEWSAENTGKIGNALKKSGVVFENSYSWMPENYRGGRGILDRIDNLEDAASSLSGVVGEVRSVQEEAIEMAKNKEAFDKALKELAPQQRADNEPVKQAVADSKTKSTGAAATEADTVKAGG